MPTTAMGKAIEVASDRPRSLAAVARLARDREALIICQAAKGHARLMNIRPVAMSDRLAVLDLAGRLAEQGTPAGRDRQQVAAADATSIAAAMDSPSPQAELLVAEADGQVVGFVHVRTVVDYYTQENIGHVSDLVVAAHAEHRGLGRALLDAAQSWAIGRGYSMMQLFVLPENSGARALYERTGYRAEWIKYIRPLR